MNNSKKGIELATNTLVVIIIGIVLLGLGFTMVVKIVNKGEDYTREVNEQLMEQLRKSQFTDGKLVAVLNPHKTIQRKDQAYFLLGFVNKDTQERNFRVIVKYNDKSPVDAVFKADMTRYGPYYANINKYILHLDTTISLDPNKDHFRWLAFTPNKNLPTGEYYYDVFICYDGTGTPGVPECGSMNLYGNFKQRLFITLK